jgi:hypothetical protein
MWKTYIEPFHAQGLCLVSPAPSSVLSGKTWLQDFLTACDGGCTVDVIGLRTSDALTIYCPKLTCLSDYYDVNATKFAEYLTDFHDTFQRPIWVTEWACQNFNKARSVPRQRSPSS